MTRNYLIELADFNIWGNDIVRSWMDQINEDQWNMHIVSSFNSIGETVLHIAGAETVWLERFNNVESPKWLPAVFKGSKKETLDLWKQASADLKKFAVEFDEEKFQSVLRYKRFDGNIYEQPYYQLFAHVFNHSTYHRGQLVTMLRQAGFTSVGATDLAAFYRIK